MPCDIQELLDDGKCFYGLSDHMLNAIQAKLLCDIAGVIESGGSAAEFFTLQADDGQWYEISSFELAPGSAQMDFGQSPVSAGTQAYRVIINLTDGLKYKFKLFEDAGLITGGYDGSGATLESETPTIFIDTSGRRYQLNFVTDGVITYQLDEL